MGGVEPPLSSVQPEDGPDGASKVHDCSEWREAALRRRRAQSAWSGRAGPSASSAAPAAPPQRTAEDGTSAPEGGAHGVCGALAVRSEDVAVNVCGQANRRMPEHFAHNLELDALGEH